MSGNPSQREARPVNTTKITITKRTTLTFYSRPTVDELVDALGQVPDDWRNGKVEFHVSRDQRDGDTITLTVEAGGR
jgi:hypothetical protein